MSRKIKYDVSFKLKAVTRSLSGKESKSKIYNELGIDKSQLSKWERYFKLYGIEGLKPKSNHYTGDFKFKVIQQMQKRCLSLKQTSLEYGIPSDSTVLTWLRIYEQEGKSGLYKNNKGRPRKMNPKKSNRKPKGSLTREQELLEENKSLRAELDFLKKLNALIQAKQSNKKKR